MAYRIGIDVGGTFTDFLLLDELSRGRSFKVLSTPDDPSDAVLAGLTEMADTLNLPVDAFLRDVSLIVHGTTITTNAVLTGRIAKTGLLTTRGFRDALQMRRGIRERPYDNKYPPAVPPVPRPLRLPVTERIDERGREITPLAVDDLAAAVEVFKREQVEAVAICFLHAWANDAHEKDASRYLRRVMPDVYISVSSTVLPQIRFYERLSTAVLNAAVGPILVRYLTALEARLQQARFAGKLLIMQSNGGVAAPATVAELAASTLLSGPAAAPVAGLQIFGAGTQASFITVDMGGTSFDAALVKDATAAITTANQINRFAMALPSLEILTIGAGGGSIGRVDEGGLLRMGPQSAGSKPGPACYARGGMLPTCSDANLMLGYLSPDFFAGGRLKLDVQAARAAIDAHIARPLDLTIEQAAAGMYRVINVNMASAIREISVQKGYDAREFPLVCAGGAGAIHAAEIARELGIKKILVPRDASIFCAAGMLRTDFKHDFVRSVTCALVAGSDELRRIPAAIEDMEALAHATLESEGVASQERQFQYSADLRYRGQFHEISVEFARASLTELKLAEVLSKFHARHDQLYGYSLADQPTVVEMISVRVRGIGLTPKLAAAVEADHGPACEAARKSRRPIWLPDRASFSEVDVYDGDALAHGNRLNGPAIVETVNTTIVVPSDCNLTLDAVGTSVLEFQS